MNLRIYFLALAYVLASTREAYALTGGTTYVKGVENAPRILSNHDLTHNALQESVYELLHTAQSSILIFSFTFSDPKVIQIINQKADEGVKVNLVIDRDHLNDCKEQLHPLIHLGTRARGEGHLHHKILVVDGEYVWLSSANFTPGGFTLNKNVALVCASKALATRLHQEALDIVAGNQRISAPTLSCIYGSQLLELYILPHNDPEAPRAVEAQMNELGKQKLISLIDTAQHHIKISVDVWTYKDASRAIINAVQRGVRVDIVVGDFTGEAVKMMTQVGVTVKQGNNLHHKFMVVDHAILLNGSPNWSMNAFSRSDESFIVLYDLTHQQLHELEGCLASAGLPIELHRNQVAPVIDSLAELSQEEIDKNVEPIKKTIAALQEHMNTTPTSKEHQRIMIIAQRLLNDLVNVMPRIKTASVPGCCLYTGDNYLHTVVSIAEKQERVEAALSYIKNVGAVDEKVTEYFQKTLKKLQAGINVPLPDYFHATRAGLESIIQDKHIVSSKTGFTGPGTYISCNNEGDHGYGSHTFAIDEGCLVDTQATFRTGRNPATNLFFSMWASVLKDIPVSEDTIAFIDTSLDDIPYVKALLEKEDLTIEVVSRGTAEGILKIFDLTTTRRELPSFFWNKFESQDYLPQNMYPRSQQGTLRQYTFKGCIF